MLGVNLHFKAVISPPTVKECKYQKPKPKTRKAVTFYKSPTGFHFLINLFFFFMITHVI